MKNLMQEYKTRIRDHYKFYSQDLLNNLFRHPYTKIEFIVKDLGVSRITAAHYLNTLAKDGLLKKEKLGVGNYYINTLLSIISPVYRDSFPPLSSDLGFKSTKAKSPILCTS